MTGSNRFQQPQLLSATGLRLGEDVDETVLKQAANRLASSGMFRSVTYQYVASAEGTEVEYRVNDNGKLLPVNFDNFVWLSTSELVKELQKREPLFTGTVPNSGDMYQQLAADTKAVLVALHVVADVRAFPQVPPRGGDVIGFTYTVNGVKLPIKTVVFPGASAEINAILQKVAETALIGNDYSQTRVRSVAALDFMPQYRMRGFLRASFADPVGKLQEPTSNAVSVQLPVSEGLSYKLASIHWSGNTMFSTSKLGKFLKIEPGKPVNEVSLESDLGAISKIYGTHGYLEAQLEPRYSFDDTAQTTAVEINVREGNQYRMGNVKFEGLAEKSVTSLQKLWKLLPGDIYDSSYPGLFLQLAGTHLSLSALRVQIQQETHPEQRTVDVTIRFSPKWQFAGPFGPDDPDIGRCYLQEQRQLTSQELAGCVPYHVSLASALLRGFEVKGLVVYLGFPIGAEPPRLGKGKAAPANAVTSAIPNPTASPAITFHPLVGCWF